VSHFLFAASKHKIDGDAKGTHPTSAIGELLRQPHLHVLVVSAVVLQLGQQLSGINAVFYYSTSFFEGVIADPLVGTNLVSLVNMVATYAAVLLMDSIGRRTLLLWSSSGMLLSSALIIAALSGIIPHAAALVAVMLFVSFFEIGLGPVPWLIVAEVCLCANLTSRTHLRRCLIPSTWLPR
jgi:SP family facilitated glucose transporter-like MFS transporter 3